MANYKVPIESYQAFRNEVNGKGYDIDGAYGYQCWDGAALLWQQIGKTLETGGQNAKGCWLVPSARQANTVEGYFKQVTNKKDIKRGDVVVFNTGGWVSETGHIAFADEDYKAKRMHFLGQNQGQGSGIQGKAFSVDVLTTQTFLGAFRFLPWNGGTPIKKTRKHFPWVVAWKHWRNFKR